MIPKKFLDEMQPKERHDYLRRKCARPGCGHNRSTHGIYSASARACNVIVQVRPVDHTNCITSEGKRAPLFRDTNTSACGCEEFQEPSE